MDEGAVSDKCDWWSKEERIVPAVEGAASLTQFPLLPALSYTHLSFWTAGDVLCLAMRPSATGNNSATNSTSAPSATSASLWQGGGCEETSLVRKCSRSLSW